jgi:hypothetical protein
MRCERMLKAQQIYGPEAPAMASHGAIAVGQRLYALRRSARRPEAVASGAGGATLLVADASLHNRAELGESLAIGAAELAARALGGRRGRAASG